jgi:uncharacterized membrane protein
MTEQFTKSIVVNGQPSTLYALWANFENFPHFMKNIKSVTKTGERTSHWKMEGPLNTTLEWDAETTRLEENKRIAWRSLEDSQLKTSGQVTFTALPQNQTEITVTLQYMPPGGVLGEAVAKLFADPEGQLDEDLRNFKTFADQRATSQ